MTSLLLSFVALTSGVALYQPDGKKDEVDDIGVDISYEKNALVISDEESVAVIVFAKTSNKSASYVYRMLNKDGSITRGKGEVMVKVIKTSKTDNPKIVLHEYDPELLIVKAGNMRFRCSPGNDGAFIRYLPESLVVQFCNPLYYESLELERFRKTQVKKK